MFVRLSAQMCKMLVRLGAKLLCARSGCHAMFVPVKLGAKGIRELRLLGTRVFGVRGQSRQRTELLWVGGKEKEECQDEEGRNRKHVCCIRTIKMTFHLTAKILFILR